MRKNTKSQLSAKLAACTSVLFSVGASSASATDIIIPNGTTLSTLQSLSGSGDRLTIEKGGKLDLPGTAIRVTGVDAFIRNSGLIRNVNSSVYGLHSDANYTSFENFGRVVATGECSYGVFIQGDHFKLTNHGSILTTDDNNAYGVYVEDGDNARLINNGSITTRGADADGIAIWRGANTRIENRGTIEVGGTDATGIYAWHTSGVDSGIVLNNSGTIRSDAKQVDIHGGQAVYANAQGMQVINSGTIISKNAEAIWMAQKNQTLTLNKGSRIEGDIRFDQTASAKLNIGKGLNASLTVKGIPAQINTNGQAYNIKGDVLTVVSDAGAAAANMGAAATSSAVAGLVGQHLAGRVGSGNASNNVSPMAYQPVSDNGQLQQPASQSDFGAWANAYGSFLVPVSNRSDIRSNHGGAVFGFDTRLGDGSVLGGFIGAGHNAARMDGGSKLDTTMGFVGLYGHFDLAHGFIDTTINFGATSNRSERAILNNTVVGGVEYASADYNGVFFSPSITYGFDHELETLRLTPRLTVQYAGIYQSGYSESGALASMTFGSQYTNAWTASGELEIGRLRLDEMMEGWSSSLKLGVEGTLLDGGKMAASVLGTKLSIAGSNETQARGFIGADFGLRQGRYDLSLKGEVGYSTNGTLSLNVKSGLRVSF